MTVLVAQRHVREISEGSLRCVGCPVANALFEATRQNWLVTTTHAIPVNGTMRQAVALPELARKAVSDFDLTGGCESFGFEFDWERGS